MQQRIEADRDVRSRGGLPGMVSLVPGLELPGEGGDDSIKMAGNDGVAWFSNMRPTRVSTWRNEITIRSLDLYAEYEPGMYVERIAPTPLLVISGTAIR